MILMFVLLLLLLVLCHSTSYRNIILTPQFGFLGGFILSVGYALFWVNDWNLELSETTFIVLFGGCGLFAVSSFLIQKIGFKYTLVLGKRKKTEVHRSCEILSDCHLYVEPWKLLLFIIIQVFILAWSIYYLVFKVGGGLTGAMYAINSASKKEEESIGFPFLLRHLRQLSFASGFFWTYIFAHRVIYKYKCHNVLLVINIVLSMIIYLLGGARQGIIQLLSAFLVMVYIFWGEKTNWNRSIKIKTFVKIVLLGFIIIFTFQFMGNVVGRNFNIDGGDYIAAYLSAEIKNLDTFIREGVFGKGASFSTTQTFAHIANQLEGKFGLPTRAFKFDQQYRYINGHYLGNVYTTFWAFLYDAGFKGLVFFTVLMATIMQLIYIRVVKNKKASQIRLSLIIYAYLYFAVAFSFFTSWFYARFFNMSFVYCVVYWSLLKLYVEKVKLRKP
jgi:oligosaccharide repeat unit polymerase